MNEPTTRETSVCAITGGTSGIGLATAKLFARHGYQIATCGRDLERLTSAQKLISLESNSKAPLTLQVDLNRPGSGREFVESVSREFGRLDVLVNNAGAAILSPFERIDEAAFEQVMNVNVRGVFHATQAAWHQMTKQGRGVIINISSMAAVDPFPGFSLYGASKAWMDLLTVALAAEGDAKGIRVYSVRPGAVETPMLRGLFPDFPPNQCVAPDEVAAKIWSCVNEPDKFSSGSVVTVTNQI